MSHIHWVARQNKLEIPKDKDEVNKQDIHDCDGRVNDPDTMVTDGRPTDTQTDNQNRNLHQDTTDHCLKS
jgi:hypothetical protein